MSDISSNLFSLSTIFAERLVITGILIRDWGLDGFEFWSVAVAATALLAIFDGGTAIVFSNRISAQVIGGQRALAIRSFRQSNAIMTALAVVGMVFVLLLAFSGEVRTLLGIHPGRFGDQAPLVVLGLGASVVLRLAMSNLVGVYRAHREFGRAMRLLTLGELVRTGAVATVALAGGSLALTAIVYAACTLGSMVQIWSFDVARRWPDFRFALERPRDGVLAGSACQLWSFGLPFFPSLALLQGPVLILGGAATLGAGTIGGFVLLRTVANFVRTASNKVVNVLAMKVSDVGEAEEERVTAALAPLRRLTAVFLGLLSGGMLYYGRPLFALWSGRDGLFDVATLAVMSAPMLLTPTYVLALAILQYRGRPMVWTIATFVQLGLAVLIYVACPQVPLALRLALAVYGSEVVAVALPVLWETHGRSLGAAFKHEAPYTLMSLGAAAGAGGGGQLLEFLVSSATTSGLLAQLAIQTTFAIGLLALLARREMSALLARGRTGLPATR